MTEQLNWFKYEKECQKEERARIETERFNTMVTKGIKEKNYTIDGTPNIGVNVNFSKQNTGGMISYIITAYVRFGGNSGKKIELWNATKKSNRHNLVTLGQNMCIITIQGAKKTENLTPTISFSKANQSILSYCEDIIRGMPAFQQYAERYKSTGGMSHKERLQNDCLEELYAMYPSFSGLKNSIHNIVSCSYSENRVQAQVEVKGKRMLWGTKDIYYGASISKQSCDYSRAVKESILSLCAGYYNQS